MNHEQLEHILSNTEAYKKHIIDIKTLCKLSKEFPKYNAALIKPLLNDQQEFKRLITTFDALELLMKQFPDHIDDIFDLIHSNPEESKRIFERFYHIECLQRQFPKQSDALIRQIFENPEEYKRLISSCYTCNPTDAAKQFSVHFEALIARVLKSPKEFNQLVNTWTALKFLAQNFRHHANSLIKMLVSDAKACLRLFNHTDELIEATRLFPTTYGDELLSITLTNIKNMPHTHHMYFMLEVAKKYPKHAKALFAPMLNDPDIFKTVVQDFFDIRNYLEQFPNDDEVISAIIFKNPEMHKRLCNQYGHLCTGLTLFPNHTKTLVNSLITDPKVFIRVLPYSCHIISLAKIVPEYSNELMDLILTNQEINQTIINNSFGSICSLAKAFPEYSERLIGPIVKNREVFNRFMTDDLELFIYKDNLPKYRFIFGQGRIEHVSKILFDAKEKDVFEIKRHAKLMGFFREKETTHLKNLPPELATKIIKLTRESNEVSDIDAEKIIHDAYQIGLKGPEKKQSVHKEQTLKHSRVFQLVSFKHKPPKSSSTSLTSNRPR